MKSTGPSSGSDGDFARSIVGFHMDDQGHWVSQLACGHNQHVRHDPPWMNRHWVTTAGGRDAMLGYRLNCHKCMKGAPIDERPET